MNKINYDVPINDISSDKFNRSGFAEVIADQLLDISTDNNKNTFVQEGNILYYNKIALCKNVSDFKVKVDGSQGKQVVNVFVEIDGTAYSTNYVVGE